MKLSKFIVVLVAFSSILWLGGGFDSSSDSNDPEDVSIETEESQEVGTQRGMRFDSSSQKPLDSEDLKFAEIRNSVFNPKAATIMDLLACLEDGIESCNSDLKAFEMAALLQKQILQEVQQIQSGSLHPESRHYEMAERLLVTNNDQLLEAAIDLYNTLPNANYLSQDVADAIELTPSLAMFQKGVSALQSGATPLRPLQWLLLAEKVIISGSPEASVWLAKNIQPLVKPTTLQGYKDILAELERLNRKNSQAYKQLRASLDIWEASNS